MPPATFETFAKIFRTALARHSGLLDRREAAGKIRRCHGDLHLRNICLFDGEPRLFDCIEFNDQIASVDVLYDLAFLLMDLWHRGFPQLANLVMNRYLDEADDEDGFILLPFFMAVRAAVRAHVTATQVEEGGAVSGKLIAEARSYFDLARTLLQQTRRGWLPSAASAVPARRPLQRRSPPMSVRRPAPALWKATVSARPCMECLPKRGCRTRLIARRSPTGSTMKWHGAPASSFRRAVRLSPMPFSTGRPIVTASRRRQVPRASPLPGSGWKRILRDPFWCALLTFSLNSAAHTTEILCRGLQSVPKGVTEAATSLGLKRFQIARLVTFPIAFRISLPAYGNEVVGMIKGCPWRAP